MSNTIEQVAAGVLVFGSIGVCIAAIIGFVVLCNRIKDWFCGRSSSFEEAAASAWQCGA